MPQWSVWHNRSDIDDDDDDDGGDGDDCHQYQLDCRVAQGKTGVVSNEHLCGDYQLSILLIWSMSKQAEKSQVIDIYS